MRPIARVQKGDTIIELVLAFAIFSLSAITTVMILNKGVAISQRSLEKTLVRQQVDSQSEIIRYIHDTKNPKWATIIANTITAPKPLAGPCPTATDLATSTAKGFYVVPDSTNADGFSVIMAGSSTYGQPATYARIDYATKHAEGLWVQVAKAENLSSPGDVKYSINAYDFYIHGCWDSVGQDAPMTVGTIVRVYDN